MDYFYTAQFYKPPRGLPADQVIPLVHELETTYHMGYLRAADEEDAIHVALTLGPTNDAGDRLPARSVTISACADDHFRGKAYIARWLSATFAQTRRKLEIIKRLSGGFMVK